MSFTVFLGNLPAWVTADDIKTWLTADDLVADSIKVIRNHETQESKGFAFVEAPTAQEMQAIIRRFDRAPLDGKLLRANAAQPTKPRGTAGAAPAPAARQHGPRSAQSGEAQQRAEQQRSEKRICHSASQGALIPAATQVATTCEATPHLPFHNYLISFAARLAPGLL